VTVAKKQQRPSAFWDRPLLWLAVGLFLVAFAMWLLAS
jgi:hypothetical protein